MKKVLIIAVLVASMVLPTQICTNEFNASAEEVSAECCCCSCETPVEYLGEFIAHAYCDCAECCGTAGNKTCTGVYPSQYRTVAVDPSIIPLGSKIAVEYADGSIQELIAEDTGSGIKGNIIDVYFESHEDALKFGHREVKIYLELD